MVHTSLIGFANWSHIPAIIWGTITRDDTRDIVYLRVERSTESEGMSGKESGFISGACHNRSISCRVSQVWHPIRLRFYGIADRL